MRQVLPWGGEEVLPWGGGEVLPCGGGGVLPWGGGGGVLPWGEGAPSCKGRALGRGMDGEESCVLSNIWGPAPLASMGPNLWPAQPSDRLAEVAFPGAAGRHAVAQPSCLEQEPSDPVSGVSVLVFLSLTVVWHPCPLPPVQTTGTTPYSTEATGQWARAVASCRCCRQAAPASQLPRLHHSVGCCAVCAAALGHWLPVLLSGHLMHCYFLVRAWCPHEARVCQLSLSSLLLVCNSQNCRPCTPSCLRCLSVTLPTCPPSVPPPPPRGPTDPASGPFTSRPRPVMPLCLCCGGCMQTYQNGSAGISDKDAFGAPLDISDTGFVHVHEGKAVNKWVAVGACASGPCTSTLLMPRRARQ